MKSILIYILHLVALTLIFDVCILIIMGIHQIRFFTVFEQLKPLVFVNLISCGTLFLFAVESNRRSIWKIILICILCWILTSVAGPVVAYLVVRYSSIPETVITYQQIGTHLAMGNSFASFVASTFTAFILILRAKRARKV